MDGIVGTATIGVGTADMAGGTILVLDGIIGVGMVVLDGITITETIGAGITGTGIIGDTLIITTTELTPIMLVEEALLTPLTQAAIEIIAPEVQQITLELRTVLLAVETIQITEEIRIQISEEILQMDSTEQVHHFQEIKIIRLLLQAEDRIQIVLATKIADRKDPILQAQETTIIPDHIALAQIVLEEEEDRLEEEEEEVVEDNNY